MKRNLYLLVQFNFPRPYKPEYGESARALHDSLQDQGWIEEVLAASGGIGQGPAALWIFALENYAGLDRLLAGEDPVSEAYRTFFSQMEGVSDFVREAVIFR